MSNMVVYPAELMHVTSNKGRVAKVHGKVYSQEQLFVRIQEELSETKNTILYGIHCMPEELLQEQLLYRYSVISELTAHLAELTSR